VRRIVGRGLIMLAGCVVALAALEAALHVAFPRMRLLTRHERLGSIPRPNMNGRTTFGTFVRGGMDLLLLENFVVRKSR